MLGAVTDSVAVVIVEVDFVGTTVMKVVGNVFVDVGGGGDGEGRVKEKENENVGSSDDEIVVDF